MMIMLATGLFDSQDEADRLMRPLQGCPGLDDAYMREFAAPVTFDIVGAIQEAMSPSGHRYAADCAWSDASAAQLEPLLRDLYTTLPTRQSFTIWYGWNPVRPLPDMAFSMEANVYLATYAVWSDPAEDERVQQWVSERYRALEPVSKGTYLGDADLLNRPAPFMAADNFRRLAAIRDEYDPQRRFPGFRVKPGATANEFERLPCD